MIAHEDPGVPNWLDTAGRGEGLVYYRWNRAEVPPPKPRVSVVPFAELRGHFPENTPRVTAQQRETVLQQRYRDVARRFGL